MAKRPLGVTILGSLAVVGGLILLIFALINLLSYLGLLGLGLPADTPREALLVSSALNLVVGILLMGTGNGLLNLSPWAWWLAAIVAVIGIARSIFAFVSGVATATTSALLSAILGLIILLLFLGYLASVRRHFR